MLPMDVRKTCAATRNADARKLRFSALTCVYEAMTAFTQFVIKYQNEEYEQNVDDL